MSRARLGPPRDGEGDHPARPDGGGGPEVGLITATLTALLLAATPATAQTGLDNLASVVTLSGTCAELIVRGEDRTASCAGGLVNSAHTDGRSGFSFIRSGEEVVDFVGEDSAAIGDRATLRVDTILVARTDDPGLAPHRLRASGSCAYTNPYAGVSTITCTADTAEGPFRARFVSDGRPPRGGRAK